MVTSVTEGGTQKLPKAFKIIETYCQEHSLESSGGALSDGTSVLKELKIGIARLQCPLCSNESWQVCPFHLLENNKIIFF
jgi:hypothetical protein